LPYGDYSIKGSPVNLLIGVFAPSKNPTYDLSTPNKSILLEVVHLPLTDFYRIILI